MPIASGPFFLIASNDKELVALATEMLGAGCARMEVALEAESALRLMNAGESPALVVLDERLPGMTIDLLLSRARAEGSGLRFPIVLLAERATPEWLDRIAAGIIDDLEPLDLSGGFFTARMEAVLRNYARMRDLEMLRESAALNAQTDPLTGAFNRQAMLSMLFRETDRVQRMKGSLCMILFDIDDFSHWNERLGEEACDELLRQVVTRTMRLLRSYDLLGRVGKDEFLLGLPGCSSMNAVLLAERLRSEVFSRPYRAAGEVIRLSACFGVAASFGRSPVIVLHEAEQVLLNARAIGPESIQCARDLPEPAPPPVAFLSATSGDELLAW